MKRGVVVENPETAPYELLNYYLNTNFDLGVDDLMTKHCFDMEKVKELTSTMSLFNKAIALYDARNQIPTPDFITPMTRSLEIRAYRSAVV